MMSANNYDYSGVKIQVSPDALAAYNDAVKKGYKGTFNDFLDEIVKRFVEMKKR